MLFSLSTMTTEEQQQRLISQFAATGEAARLLRGLYPRARAPEPGWRELKTRQLGARPAMSVPAAPATRARDPKTATYDRARALDVVPEPPRRSSLAAPALVDGILRRRSAAAIAAAQQVEAPAQLPLSHPAPSREAQVRALQRGMTLGGCAMPGMQRGAADAAL